MTRWPARIVFVLAVLAAASASAQPVKDWDKAAAAAKREGEVVVYSAYIGSPSNRAIAAAFEKRYGIKVTTFEARGAELRERIRTEQTTGRFLADVLHHATVVTLVILQKDKALQPHGPIPSAGRLKAGFAADDMMVPVFTINYGILVNTSLVKPGEEPKSWLDVLDPKWKSKILIDDPRAPGGGRVWFVATYDRLGRGYQEKLAQQDIRLANQYRDSERRLARGEFALYLPYILSDDANLAGLPVKHVVPKEGATYGSYSVSMFRNAPHPNAARLLIDFYLSDEVQAIYAREAHGIMVDGVLDKMPPDIRDLAGVKLFGTNDTPDRQDEMFARAREIYK